MTPERWRQIETLWHDAMARIEADSAVKAGVPQVLLPTIYQGGVYAHYAASNDGQRFLVPVPPALEDAAPITVLVNWTASLAE